MPETSELRLWRSPLNYDYFYGVWTRAIFLTRVLPFVLRIDFPRQREVLLLDGLGHVLPQNTEPGFRMIENNKSINRKKKEKDKFLHGH